MAGIYALMQTVKTRLLMLTCLLWLTACGLKGPLYLPDEVPATQADTRQGPEPDAEETASKDTAKKKDSASS